MPDDADRVAFTCWVRGKKHWVQTRANDRAQNQQSPGSPLDVRIQAAVSKFVITPVDAQPYVAGVAHPLTIEAQDNLNNTAAGFTGQVRFITETAGAPELVGDGLPADSAATFVNGWANNVNGLAFRMAGSRDLKVCKLEGGTPNCSIFGSVMITVTTATVDRLLIMNAEQTHRPGCNSQNANCASTDGMGRQGSPTEKPAGTAYNVRVRPWTSIITSSLPAPISALQAPTQDDAERNVTYRR